MFAITPGFNFTDIKIDNCFYDLMQRIILRRIKQIHSSFQPQPHRSMYLEKNHYKYGVILPFAFMVDGEKPQRSIYNKKLDFLRVGHLVIYKWNLFNLALDLD